MKPDKFKHALKVSPERMKVIADEVRVALKKNPELLPDDDEFGMTKLVAAVDRWLVEHILKDGIVYRELVGGWAMSCLEKMDYTIEDTLFTDTLPSDRVYRKPTGDGSKPKKPPAWIGEEE